MGSLYASADEAEQCDDDERAHAAALMAGLLDAVEDADEVTLARGPDTSVGAVRRRRQRGAPPPTPEVRVEYRAAPPPPTAVYAGVGGAPNRDLPGYELRRRQIVRWAALARARVRAWRDAACALLAYLCVSPFVWRDRAAFVLLRARAALETTADRVEWRLTPYVRRAVACGRWLWSWWSWVTRLTSAYALYTLLSALYTLLSARWRGDGGGGDGGELDAASVIEAVAAGIGGSYAATHFVQHGEPGVHFDLASAPLRCDQLRAEHVSTSAPLPGIAANDAALATLTLSAVRERATAVLAARLRAAGGGVMSEPPCVCAPMFGARLRLVSVLDPGGGGADAGGAAPAVVHHLYNMTLALDEARAARVQRSRVDEDDAPWFPQRVGPVTRKRYNVVEAHYVNLACEPQRVRLRGAHAHCVQYCHDMLAGTLAPPPPPPPPPLHS